MTCSCIRIDCCHPKGECGEPPVIRGGICTTCRFYKEPSLKCKVCGGMERREDIINGVCLVCAEAITFSLNARRARIVP